MSYGSSKISMELILKISVEYSVVCGVSMLTNCSMILQTRIQ